MYRGEIINVVLVLLLLMLLLLLCNLLPLILEEEDVIGITTVDPFPLDDVGDAIGLLLPPPPAPGWFSSCARDTRPCSTVGEFKSSDKRDLLVK